jgi:hypothetical protein
MSLFTDTLFNSFSSAGDYPAPSKKYRRGARLSSLSQNNNIPPLVSEMEVLQVAGIPSELHKFYGGLSQFKRDYNLRIRFSILAVHSPADKKHRRRLLNDGHDDPIEALLTPLYDLFTTEEPEVHLLRIDGSHHSIEKLNALTSRMIESDSMIVSVKVKSRQVITVDSIPENVSDNIENILSNFFSDDLSKSMPLVHNMMVCGLA